MTRTTTRAVLAIVGVTASGKSALAMEFARRHEAVELVSIDSMQIYRGMDIGTAKPTAAERTEVAHHMIDIVDPWDEFTVSEFQSAARAAIADIESRGGIPVLVGGTGLHLRAIVDDLDIPARYPAVVAELEREPDTTALHARLREIDPLGAGRMDPANRRRVMRALEVSIGSGRPFSSFGPGLDAYLPTRFRMIGPRLSRTVIDHRIAQRYQEQMERGLLAEVAALVGDERGLSRTAAQALGYRQLAVHLAGEESLEQALSDAIMATRRFARRQERWFRRDPRITWIEVDGNPMAAFDALMGEWSRCS